MDPRDVGLVWWRGEGAGGAWEKEEKGCCLTSPHVTEGSPAPPLPLQILVKTMIRKRSFGNPFEGSRREERSLSAPGNLLA